MEFHAPSTLPTPLGYSHAVSVEPGRRLVFLSGQVGLTADGVVSEGWEAQTRQTFRNLGLALGAAGAAWSDVVKLTYFVTTTDELPLVRAIRDEFVDVEHPPASSLVQVAGLFRPDVVIEVEAVAAVAG
ncbi:Enamine deaminase RidA, house cleaning of reactive enamine intermediates, YjgF/YER057c/UK114 family [Nocardioides terrae]|uniref:Enamine deaminase RidA, house cleaning of reactive enamine intermediates, YjgF/YER057c/UK114 family n=1 Tax=Nocardioides terrae TaxID=574651 RepID=A0A1I1D577_9ACTN|nr:RidA family protein [Nocardioides terrae]SFB69947.1 Enamine deaminase RidA, house cleaning of reactive enamine intermediates, YjgF/YER057c/UK114 family [Nocardioides terrae]